MDRLILESKKDKYTQMKSELEAKVLTDEELETKVQDYKKALICANKEVKQDIEKCGHYCEMLDELLLETEQI